MTKKITEPQALRTVTVRVRLTPAEHQRLISAAEHVGLSVSQFLRSKALYDRS